MKLNQPNKRLKTITAILILQFAILPVGTSAYAAVTDISDIPLAAFSSVKPNLMYTLDNSGSMTWNSVTGFDGLAEYSNANRAFYSSSYNKIYYNPTITYTPPVNYLGVSMGNAPPGAARVDPFPTAGGSLATTRLTDTCNGTKDSVATAIPTPGTCANDLTRPVAMYAFYYVWDGVTNIAVANPGNAAFPQRVDITQGRTYPRPTAANPAGLKAATRTDCITPTAATATTCTYNEEIQNFANWFSYYSSRILMTKTSLGRVFAKLNDKFRVGFNAINTTSTDNQTAPPAGSAFWQNVDDFNATNKQAWFNRVYAIDPQNSTPLRNQMQKIGRYFEGKFPGATDPMQYSCQSNYHIMSTDGFWNDGVPGSPTVSNVDSDPDPAGYSSVASGAFDRQNQSNTLSDVALYYYKNDLRDSSKANCTGALGFDVCANNVKTNSKDGAKHQHMVVYTVGLGAGGQNAYFEDYEIRSESKYLGKGYDPTFWLSRMKAGDTSPANNWPAVPGNTQTTIDDLWHAAINARGTYLNAGSPDRLIAGLGGILNDIAAKEGAGAGAALSSNDLKKNVPAGAFPVRYDSSDWSGEVIANTVTIDSATGLTVTVPAWNARELLDAQVAGTGWKNNRKIFTIGNGTTPKPFEWDKLSTSQQTALGTKDVLEYLRGDTSNPLFRPRKHVLGDIVGSEPVFVTAPNENYKEADNPGYETVFKQAYENRKPMLYVGANDGMLHAFDPNLDTTLGGGQELWAYIPTFVYNGPNGTPTVDGLAALANPTYTHHFYVDAKAHVKDVDFSRTGGDPKLVPLTTHDWHTMLVGGLGKGGRGYYALDITNPTSDATDGQQTLADSKILWEFTDPDMGFTYGEPLVTKTRKWGWVVVVSSGYNNISGPNPGQGFLYILNAKTGALLQKIGTGVGTATNPSGLTHFTSWTADEGTWLAEQMYAGDLLGNLWRFDVSQLASVSTPFSAPLKFATLTDGATPQPITTTPVTGLGVNNVDRYVFVGTGKLLGVSDSPNAQTQTIYGFHDGGKNVPYTSGTLPASVTFPMNRSHLAKVTDTLIGTTTAGMIGWYFDLGHDTADPTSPAERVIIHPASTNGTVTFGTATPTSGSACNANIKGDAYALKFENGKTRLRDSATNTPLAKISSPDGIAKIQLVRINGKIRAIATDTQGKVVTLGGGALGNEQQEGKPHRHYWREVLQ
ncbi:MAG: PilC/PilY family type IV pilus protein [Burkholderiales bacterium]